MRLLILSVILLSNILSFACDPMRPEELLHASETVGNPESPDYDENAFCRILSRALDSPYIDEADRLRASMRLESARKNRPGTVAADFSFTTRDNSVTSLYKYVSDLPIILIFYDPDCSHCMEVFDELRSTGVTEKASILAIDAEDDKERWDKTAESLPAGWTVGFAGPDIQDNETYVFLTSPAIYLLSPDKTVILKDATPERILKALSF